MPADSVHDDSVPSGISSLLSSLESITDSTVEKEGSAKLVLSTPIKPSSSSSSGSWGSFEEMRPLVQDPVVAPEVRYTRPAVGSPMASDNDNNAKATTHGNKHFTSFPKNVPVAWSPAGMSLNVLFPGFSKSLNVQDVYTEEPPASKHVSKHVNGKVKVPLNIAVGQGVTAQTIGPISVNAFASVA